MADRYYFPMEHKRSSLEDLAAQSYRDPIRQYLGEQSIGAYGDAGASATTALLMGAGAGSANPILGALLGLGFGTKAFNDVLRAREYSGAEGAFGKTGLPGAPMGQQLPLPHEDIRIGRYAAPDLIPGGTNGR